VLEIRRVRGDDPSAVEAVATMEGEVAAALGPMTADRTSTVAPTEMVPPGGWFVLLAEDGRVVAGGGVRRLSDGIAEIKRMWVAPSLRGRGLGRRLLEELEAAAADLGYTRVRLDTAASMEAALALYGRAGYRAIPDYNGNGYAAFWGEKVLPERPAAG
jgi:ribosomal protein S18 acetylase RimI-like enzyme